MKPAVVPALAVLGALACAGCLSFRFDRATANLPPKPGVVAGLTAGTSSLDAALAALGAPIYVWEYKGDGMALAWGWNADAARGVTLSVPLDHGGSASASYDDLAQHLHGVVLFFDANLVLREVREGYLNQFQSELRRRPALVEPAAPAPAKPPPGG